MMEVPGLRCAVLSVTAGHTVRDAAGDLLAARAQAAGHELVRRVRVADDEGSARRALAECIADPGIQLVLAVGGTGFARRNTMHDVAGYANRTLVFCLPGATGACALAWDRIIAPQLKAPVL